MASVVASGLCPQPVFIFHGAHAQRKQTDKQHNANTLEVDIGCSSIARMSSLIVQWTVSSGFVV